MRLRTSLGLIAIAAIVVKVWLMIGENVVEIVAVLWLRFTGELP